MYQWIWKTFDQLSTTELYEILKVRQEVFIVEQDCPYQDCDGLDLVSWHLFAIRSDKAATGEICAYLRIVPPSYKFKEPSIGRVLTSHSARGTGIGKDLMARAMTFMVSEYGNLGIRISAQLYLQRFYTSFGFEQVSQPYDEDDIPHIEMLYPAG